MGNFMNILVIKTGALGDVVRTSFIAQALNDKYKKHNPLVFIVCPSIFSKKIRLSAVFFLWNETIIV